MGRDGWPDHFGRKHNEHPFRDLLTAIRNAFRPPRPR